jgi:hypothetical protein
MQQKSGATSRVDVHRIGGVDMRLIPQRLELCQQLSKYSCT